MFPNHSSNPHLADIFDWISLSLCWTSRYSSIQTFEFKETHSKLCKFSKSFPFIFLILLFSRKEILRHQFGQIIQKLPKLISFSFKSPSNVSLKIFSILFPLKRNASSLSRPLKFTFITLRSAQLVALYSITFGNFWSTWIGRKSTFWLKEKLIALTLSSKPE